MAEHRQFKRLSLQLPARLKWAQGDVGVTVQDISLKGVLIETSSDPANSPALTDNESDLFTLEILSDPERLPLLVMDIRAVRRGQQRIAGEWIDIDLSSLTNLRTLLDYNLGDEMLSRRELPDLWHE